MAIPPGDPGEAVGYHQEMIRHRSAVLAVTLGLVALPLVAGQESTALAQRTSVQQAVSEVKSTSIPPDPTTPEQARANEVSGAIAERASSVPGYGGIWVDETGITHVAVAGTSDTGVTRAIGDDFGGEYVTEQVESSYDDLLARRDAISTRIPDLKKQGLDLLEWGPDEKNNSIWISLRNYTLAKAELARNILGNDVLVEPAMAPGDERDLYSRTNDGSPFSAGIFLYPKSSTYPYCSSGMPIVISGTRYLVTAGHCYDPVTGGTFPSDVYNGGLKDWAIHLD